MALMSHVRGVLRAVRLADAEFAAAMAHPEDGTLVSACVQHCVLDPAENRDLRTLLPLPGCAPAPPDPVMPGYPVPGG